MSTYEENKFAGSSDYYLTTNPVIPKEGTRSPNCPLCDETFDSVGDYKAHTKSNKHAELYLKQMSSVGPKVFYQKYGNIAFCDPLITSPYIWRPSKEKDPFMVFALRCGIFSKFICQACQMKNADLASYKLHLLEKDHRRRTYARMLTIGEENYRAIHFNVPGLAQEKLFDRNSFLMENPPEYAKEELVSVDPVQVKSQELSHETCKSPFQSMSRGSSSRRSRSRSYSPKRRHRSRSRGSSKRRHRSRSRGHSHRDHYRSRSKETSSRGHRTSSRGRSRERSPGRNKSREHSRERRQSRSKMYSSVKLKQIDFKKAEDNCSSISTLEDNLDNIPMDLDEDSTEDKPIDLAENTRAVKDEKWWEKTLFINELPGSHVTANKLLELVEPYGTVVEHELIYRLGAPHGASVEMSTISECLKAIEMLNGKKIQGCPHPLVVKLTKRKRAKAVDMKDLVVHFSGMPANYSKEDYFKICRPFGHIESILPTPGETTSSANVKMETKEQCLCLIGGLNGKKLPGTSKGISVKFAIDSIVDVIGTFPAQQRKLEDMADVVQISGLPVNYTKKLEDMADVVDISGLPVNYTKVQYQKIFEPFGKVHSFMVFPAAKEATTTSVRVRMSKREESLALIAGLNGTTVTDKIVMKENATVPESYDSVGSVASKLMTKMGYKKGHGLGKMEQGMSTALIVEKTHGHTLRGKIIHERDIYKGTQYHIKAKFACESNLVATEQDIKKLPSVSLTENKHSTGESSSSKQALPPCTKTIASNITSAVIQSKDSHTCSSERSLMSQMEELKKSVATFLRQKLESPKEVKGPLSSVLKKDAGPPTEIGKLSASQLKQEGLMMPEQINKPLTANLQQELVTLKKMESIQQELKASEQLGISLSNNLQEKAPEQIRNPINVRLQETIRTTIQQPFLGIGGTETSELAKPPPASSVQHFLWEAKKREEELLQEIKCKEAKVKEKEQKMKEQQALHEQRLKEEMQRLVKLEEQRVKEKEDLIQRRLHDDQQEEVKLQELKKQEEELERQIEQMENELNQTTHEVHTSIRNENIYLPKFENPGSRLSHASVLDSKQKFTEPSQLAESDKQRSGEIMSTPSVMSPEPTSSGHMDAEVESIPAPQVLQFLSKLRERGIHLQMMQNILSHVRKLTPMSLGLLSNMDQEQLEKLLFAKPEELLQLASYNRELDYLLKHINLGDVMSLLQDVGYGVFHLLAQTFSASPGMLLQTKQLVDSMLKKNI